MKHPGGPWGRPLFSLCAFPFCTSLRGPARAVAIRLSGSCSQVIFCAINFSLCGQIEQKTNWKAIPQTNCAPRSVAAAAYATNVPPAHLLNAAAKETPFRGEDSVFFPPKNPLIETAKGGGEAAAAGGRGRRILRSAAAPLAGRREASPGKAMRQGGTAGPLLDTPGDMGTVRSRCRGDPRGRPKKNGLPRRFAPRNDVEKGNPCEAPSLVLHPGSAKRSGSARNWFCQSIPRLRPDK